MSQGNQSYLRFSLEESVWFQKGQEVAELLSISLDPNITIQENEQYVTIKGSLELTGEYKRYEEEEVEEEGFSSPKFVHSVEERDEGVFEFSHRFPVDITIPNNRIESVYDVDVEVESFDYLFPEISCLKLTADLAITGLYGEQQHSTAEVEEEEPELALEYRNAAVEEETEEAQEVPVQAVQKTDYQPFEAEARKIPSFNEFNQDSTNQEIPQQQQYQQPQYQAELPTLQEESYGFEEEAPAAPEVSFSAKRNEYSPPVEVVDEAVEEAVEEAEEESPESSSSSSEVEAKKKKKASKKKGLSIAEFLARKEDESDSAKLKVCIVQQGDTLDIIAERYDVSVQNLLRVNHLEIDQDVYEGQVLYVPQAYAKN